MLLLDELRDAWRTEPRDHRVALVAIVVAAVALRLLYLSQPMRYDEAVTYLEYAQRPLGEALSRYTYPNNHLFHTLLVKVSVGVFGSAPWSVRLPAFLFGVALVPATYAVGRAIYGARAALFGTAYAATSGVLILFSTNARGYSIVGLAFLLLVLLALRIMRESSWRLWIAFAAVMAVGAWTIPTMLYPAGAVCLWLGLNLLVDRKHGEWPEFAGALALAAALTLLAYAPIFLSAGVGAVVRNKFVTSSAWPQFLSDLSDTSWETLRSWGLGLPPFVSLAALALAIRALSRHATLSRTRVGLPLAVLVWCAWLLVVSHRAPFSRVWLWLLPIVALLAGAGLVVTLESWPRTRALATKRMPLLVLIVAAGFATSVVVSRAALRSKDTGTFVDAERVAAILSSVVRRDDRVVAPLPSNAPLIFYFVRRGVDPSVLYTDEEQANRVIVIVNQDEGQTLEEILEQSSLKDTSRYSGRLVAELPSSAIVLFERKHVTPR